MRELIILGTASQVPTRTRTPNGRRRTSVDTGSPRLRLIEAHQVELTRHTLKPARPKPPALSVDLAAGVAASATPATLADHLPTRRPRHYPSDTSDAEWAILAPQIPAGSGRGRPVCHPRRDAVDAIRYLDRRWHSDPYPRQSPRAGPCEGRTPHLAAVRRTDRLPLDPCFGWRRSSVSGRANRWLGQHEGRVATQSRPPRHRDVRGWRPAQMGGR